MTAPTSHTRLLSWVDDMARLCRPETVVWCDGSEEEKQRLTQECLANGELEALDAKKLPGCYYSRSDPNDVARTENLTFICTHSQADSGPTNNWMAPQDAYRKLGDIFKDAMRGRTMYVVPFIM